MQQLGMLMAQYKTLQELEQGLDFIRQSPKDCGAIALIACRPEVNARRELESATLDVDQGLVGDNWKQRRHANPDMQLNLMNARVIALLAQERSEWMLAGDQFYIDLDLSWDNLPVGTRLSLGTAVIEVTGEPHLGCRKFTERFGADATKFVNSSVGKALNLRGINARVVMPGTVSAGMAISRIPV